MNEYTLVRMHGERLMREAELDRLAHEARRSAWAAARSRRRGGFQPARRLISAAGRAWRGWAVGGAAVAGRVR